MRKLAVFAVFLLLLLLGSSTNAFSLSPTKYLLTAKPGDNKNVKISIENDDDTDLLFKFSVLGAKQHEKGLLTFVMGASAAENWVWPEKKEVTLAPGEKMDVKYYINVPENASSGAYTLGLATTAMPKGAKSGIGGQLVSVLALQVAGDAKEMLSVEKWEAQHKVTTRRQWNFDLRLQNKGNVDLQLNGKVNLYFFGKKITTEVLNTGTNSLLTGAERAIKLSFFAPMLLPGKYEVMATVDYGRVGQKIVVSTDVWYCPWWTIALLIVVLGIMGGFYYKKNLSWPR